MVRGRRELRRDEGASVEWFDIAEWLQATTTLKRQQAVVLVGASEAKAKPQADWGLRKR